MIEILLIFSNVFLEIAVVLMLLKESKQKNVKDVLPKKKIEKEISSEDKRNFEILNQIQRYDGTKFLRKE